MLPPMTDAEYARYGAVFEGADRFAFGAPVPCSLWEFMT